MRSQRNCSTVEPAGHMTIEKLPLSNDEAKAKAEAGRQYNLKEGWISATMYLATQKNGNELIVRSTAAHHG